MSRRIVALLLGLSGASWFVYADFIAPFMSLWEEPVPIPTRLVGALAIVAAVGVLMRMRWARWLGVAAVSLFLLSSLSALVWRVSHTSDGLPVERAVIEALSPAVPLDPSLPREGDGTLLSALAASDAFGVLTFALAVAVAAVILFWLLRRWPVPAAEQAGGPERTSVGGN